MELHARKPLLKEEVIMSFTPFELSVKEILSGENRYKIPNFQRDFSWEKNNFDDFVNDLKQHNQKTKRESNSKQPQKYFFGMILLIGDKSNPDVNNPYEVIDGQQRLTAMTLFYAAIINIIKEYSPGYKIEFPERLYFENIKKGSSTQIQRLVNEALDPFLPIAIFDLNKKKTAGAEVSPDSFEQHWLKESYEYIKSLLSKKNFSEKDISDEEYIGLLEEIGDQLSNSTMICIYHDNKTEAHTLFRNLNYRGKPLSQSDLIKNEIFSLLEDESNYAYKTWSEIEANIYDSGEDLRQFIYHYMYGRYSNITNKNLFERFLDNVDRTEESFIEFLESLKRASMYYKIMLKPDEDDTVFRVKNYFRKDDNPMVRRYLKFFNCIEISQVRILLLALFECREEEHINNRCFRDFIKLIGKHQCIHVLVKSSANKLTHVYTKASKSLLNLKNAEKNQKGDKTEIILRSLENDLIDKLPDKNAIIESDLGYTGKDHSEMKAKELKEHAIVRFILGTISEERQSKESNRGNDGLGFIYNSTIEHIIDKSTAIENVYSLGNLILLEKDIHKDVDTMEDKKTMYSNSRITMTNTFFDRYVSFNPTDIMSRKAELLTEYYNHIVNNR